MITMANKTTEEMKRRRDASIGAGTIAKDGNCPYGITQRALVLQGGGALAAYEVGVYGALYFWIKKRMQKQGRTDENIFDIISGTSGGAINAWIVINHVLYKRHQGHGITDSWKGSLIKLIDFWNHTSSTPDFTKWGPYSLGLEMEQISGFLPYPIWKWTSDEKSWMSRWDGERNRDNSIATGEQARRYYSTKEFLYSGAANVFSPLPKVSDNKFFDNIFPPSNIWYQYSNRPLRQSIDEFSRLKSVATGYFGDSSEDQNQGKIKCEPRLLVVAVDVEKGVAVTFDSYEKEGRTRKTEFVADDGQHVTMLYSKGVTIDHVMASASVPINYDYALVPTDSDNPYSTERKFWDGGVLSNTPLRELIQSHEDYWNLKKEDSGKTSGDLPMLEVYIANIWPSRWNGIPSDHDSVTDRKYDLTSKDKTLHEEKVAYLIHDYIELSKKLLDFAMAKGASDLEIEEYLASNLVMKSKHRNGTPRKYHELLQKKVEISRVMRIERKYDPSEIAYKWCDYSCETVSHMIERGMEEALENMIVREKVDDVNFGAGKELADFIALVEREKVAEGLTQGQPRILKKPAAEMLIESAYNIQKLHNY